MAWHAWVSNWAISPDPRRATPDGHQDRRYSLLTLAGIAGSPLLDVCGGLQGLIGSSRIAGIGWGCTEMQDRDR